MISEVFFNNCKNVYVLDVLIDMFLNVNELVLCFFCVFLLLNVFCCVVVGKIVIKVLLCFVFFLIIE